MRRLLAFLLVSMFLVVPGHAEDDIVPRIVALAQRVQMKAALSDRTSMYTIDESIQSLAAEWGQGDRTQPRLVVDIQGQVAVDAAPHLVARALAMALISREGANAVAMSSILHSEDIFASNVTGGGLLLLLYEDAAPVLAYWQGENGAVRLNALPLLANETLEAAETAADVSAWLLDAGYSATCTLATDDAFRREVTALGSNDPADFAVRTAARLLLNARDPENLARAGASEAVADMIRTWAGEGATEPNAMYRLEMPVWFGMLPKEADSWPEAIRQETERQVGAVAAIVAGRQGVEELAAISVATCMDVYGVDAPGAGLYLLTYEDAQPVLASWWGQEGAISVSATFLTQDIDALNAAVPGIQCAPIPLPE